MGDGADGGRRIDLRLALVCYGGVSLAVYMHGVTKELHKLVRASRAFDAASSVDAPNPFSERETERSYFEALRGLAREGRWLSATIDVIAGTSAGGINGVALSKALALDADQEGLKKVWIEEGDLRKLMRMPLGLSIGGTRTRLGMAAARLLTTFKTPTSPLKGELMSQLLVTALEDIDRTRGDGTLLPPNGTLDLFVTVTDLHGFEVIVPTGAGGASQRDRLHAQVLHFHSSPGAAAAFGHEATPELAFAARATSSFPGAFAPVSPTSFVRESGASLDRESLRRRFVSQYEESGVTADDAWFVDGGVLDNAPFDLVVRAIGAKRAEKEVQRRIVYVQPDPGEPLVPAAPATPHEAPAEPAWLDGVWRAVIGVKGSHGVLRDLIALRDLNVRIAQIGAVVRAQEKQVLAETLGALGDGGWAVGDADAVQNVSDQVHERAQRLLGAGYPSYCRLKAELVARRLADEVATHFVYPADSGRTSFLRAALGAWARARDEWAAPSPQRLLELLGPVDLPYRERRLHFLLAGVNGLYDHAGDAAGRPRRADLDRLKAAAWDQLELLREAPRRAAAGLHDSGVLAFLSSTELDLDRLADPAVFADEHDEDIARLYEAYRDAMTRELGNGSTPLWEAYASGTTQWDRSYREALLSRYLGFPLWDGLIFPTVALSELPQFTPIGVAQFSPLTASALPTPEGGKLKGTSLHHFAAFLDPAWRENDYLWGRLDGAELVLRTLYDAGDAGAGAGTRLLPADEAVAAAGGSVLRSALRAVLASETDLQRIPQTREHLAESVARLPV